MNDLSVQDLRQSLREKGLSCRGSKKQLVQRLHALHESMGVNPSSDPPIKYRVTLFCLGSNQATMLLLAPGPGSRLLSQILQRASNKFRIRAKRVFVAGSGAECGVESIDAVVRDGVKLVVSSGGKYEMQSATGSPTILGMSAADSPLQPRGSAAEEEDDGVQVVGPQSDGGSLVEGDGEQREELKMDSLELRSDAGSTGLSVDDGKSEEGEGRVLFSSVASPSPPPTRPTSLFSSISSTLASIPSWLPSPLSQPMPALSSLSPSLSVSDSIPIPPRDGGGGKGEKAPFSLSPSPSHSSSSSSSPTLVSSSPVPSSSHLLYSLSPSAATSASASTPSPTRQLPGASSSPSPFPSPSSAPSVDEDIPSLLAENARLRESLRSYDEKRRVYRRMELQLRSVQQRLDAADAERERIKDLETSVKDWSDRYADSEERLTLQVRANEKAVREKEGLKAKHAAVVDRLAKSQVLKAEMEALQKAHRELQAEMAELRGKNMEEKSLGQLQALLEFHQHMVVRLHSVVVARMDGERKALNEKWQCKICFERDINVMLQPCNHAVCCSRCAPLINCCPICRRSINIRSPMHLA